MYISDKTSEALDLLIGKAFDLNRSFTSMNLRRTDSCFFSINTNDDDNRNNNSKNSFTVFNRKSDIVPNLEEEDIKENNNRLNNKNL